VSLACGHGGEETYVTAGELTQTTGTTAGSVPSAATIQRRTLTLLFCTQIIGGVGVAIGIAVGALLAAAMGGKAISGLGQSSLTVGAALLALPVSALTRRRGRRPGLALAYLIGAAGAAIIVVGAGLNSIPVVFAGLFLFGGGNAANLQARYAAVDLSEPARRGRQLSIIVWATTIGAVAGPNLAATADDAVHRFGAATYSGPFVFSALAFALAAVILWLLLRPDPLLLSRTLAKPAPVAEAGSPTAAAPPGGLRAAAREVFASPGARLGIASMAVGHAVMIAVMAMTPVHIGEGNHGDVLRIVGIVLSAHIAGMYAFSLVTGWLTDKVGRRPVILGGVGLLLTACAIAGTAGYDTTRLTIGLVLLGMGWSGTMVAGSTLLTESVGVANRPSVQGLSDMTMGLAGASAGAASGFVVAWSSYATLAMFAALVTVPLVALALRPVRPMRLAEEG
jgi:MFS family permease